MNQPPGIPTVSPRDAAAALSDAARSDGSAAPLLVDVREPSEFAESRVAGVALLPVSQFVARHAELPKDRPLLMICHAGSRSASATMFLLQNGWTNVRNVEGGMLAWERDGLPVERGEPVEGEGALPG
jgi:rhodanese-related sulfurtransferase